MATKTLYNTYRPKTFADVVGQQIPVKTMQNAIETDNVSSAYLLSGPRGTGKTTCARIFAKSLLCIGERKGADGCGECRPCREIETEMSSDLQELDGASNRGIDNVRQIIEKVQFAPVSSNRRVFIIDEVHHLTSDAFTALLKVIEEPPNNVVFLLATTDPQKVPPTIRSRCQWLNFKPLTNRQVEDRLSYVLGRENLTAEDGVVQFIAKRADGGLRDALSMLDLLITCTGKDKILLSDAEACFGVVKQELVINLANLIIDHDLAQLIGFTVRNRESDIVPKDILVALHELLSLAIIIDKCGIDAAYALESANKQSADCAAKLAKQLGCERIIIASDVIARNLWKFENPALDDAHVFNEIILAVAEPTLDPRHLRLDDADREIINGVATKSENIAKTLKALTTLVQQQGKKVDETHDNVRRIRAASKEK